MQFILCVSSVKFQMIKRIDASQSCAAFCSANQNQTTTKLNVNSFFDGNEQLFLEMEQVLNEFSDTMLSVKCKTNENTFLNLSIRGCK